MKKSFVSISIVLLMCLFAGFTSIETKAATVATFADPSRNSDYPLFTVDFTEMTLNGRWDSTGLLLYIYGNPFADTWFEMTEVDIIDTFGNTDGGEINFYANGTSTNPLLVINFESGYVDTFNFGADEFWGENVTISGSQIAGALLEEQFSFAFANLAHLEGSQSWTDGFTATAVLTSSATVVPEPATVCILGLGALSLIRRKNN